MRLRDLPWPFVICVVYDDEIDAAAQTIRAAERDGADAFELNLPRLGYPRAERLAPIFAATDRPVFTSCRRAPFTDVYGPCAHRPREMPDEERMTLQLDALACGSAGIDMELDTFDPHPAEVTEDPDAVARQRAVIKQVHALGREVMMSCHAARVLPPEEAIRIGRLIAGRGADLAKIVGVSRGIDDMPELLRANLSLGAAMPVPFTLMSVGGEARLGRFLAPLFGSAWAFGQARRGAFAPMPLVLELRAVFDAIRPPSSAPAEASRGAGRP
jgi:3-dehydroquinate dehydratase